MCRSHARSPGDGLRRPIRSWATAHAILILIPGFVSNVETAWTWPAHARFLRRLAAGRRLIVFDKRGTGLSDPVADPSCLTLEQRMDEVRAVIDAAGAHRAALFGFSEGAALGMLFAASYPSRTNGLILYGGLISPALDTAANAVVNVFADPAAAWETMRQVWGTGQFMAPFLPTATSTESEMAHVARFERHGASPAAAYAIIRMAAAIDVRGLCPAVHAPSLVMHRRDDLLVPSANSRYLAEHLPDVRYVELDGVDHPLWVGENERFFDEVNRFLSTDHPALSGWPSLLAVLLAADRALDASLLAVIERFRGRPAPGCGGVIYTFDGAVRAVECALALIEQQPALQLTVHAGERQFWHLANHSGQTGCRETRRARTAAVRTAPPREDAHLHPRAPRTHVNGNGILTLMRVHRRSILLLPVGEPVQQRVQHGDPSIAYLRHVVAGGRGRLLRHSVSEGQVAQIAEHVDRPRGGECKSRRPVDQLLGACVQFLVAPGRRFGA